MKSPFQCRNYASTATSSSSSFFFSIILSFFFLTTTNVVADDAGYMLRLLEALTPTPAGWSNNTHYCKWKGIVCNETTSRVHTIKLSSMSLKGELPPNLYTLSNLTHLDLHNNSLTGPLLVFRNIEVLHLGYNNFTFTAVTSLFFNMIKLQTLNLSNNLNFEPWFFPTRLGHFPYLHTIDLEATNLVGSLPSQTLDFFPSLETLVLSHNYLSGPLPSSLAKSAIKCLKLNNQGVSKGFSGPIEVISYMKLLSQAWLNNNNFMYFIPDFSNSTHLFDLQLHSNSLFGVVPPSLMALSSLKNVSLDYNSLEGPIPVFNKGVKATWKNNSFCGTDVGPCDPNVMTLLQIIADFSVATSYFEWQGNDPCIGWRFIECKRGQIVTINLGNQELEGTISPAFSNLKDLVNLTLSINYLTGSIPESLTTLSRLQVLDVSNNNVSGKIPKFSPKVKLITRGNALLNGGDQSKKLAMPFWISGALVFSVGVATLIVIICKRKRYIDLVQKRIFKKTRTLINDNVENFIRSYNLSVAKRYSYAEVKKITNSFKNKLGHGGYGIVYKGKLIDDRQVAVKVINESKGDGEEFINEVASISRTLHVNIVSLLGFCYEIDKRALIYEFMPNGSLDKFIYRSGFPSAICSLDCNKLYQIAVGIARGLEYLHQGCISRILHLDIKPQNILLDEEFCPKISDFGLAKICQKNDSIVSILGTRGTIGFIAPEVFSRTFGGVSHKSDVYSYGMLILEMIGGRKNYDTGESNTTEMYFSNWINKDLELTDSLVNGLSISEEEKDTVRKLTIVSLWCIQTNPLDRPSMNKIIEMLQGPLQSIPYPPKPVLYTPQCSSLQSSFKSSKNLLETNQ